MALKSDRKEFDTDISFFMNEVAERGGIVVHDTTVGSGAAMDQGINRVTYAAAPSGRTPVGVLLNDMVNIDLTRQKLNNYRNEVQRGGKVTVLRKGYVVTDRILGAVTAPGANIFLAHSGLMSASDVIGASPICGQFLSTRDQDGFAKAEVNFPLGQRRG